MNTSTPSTSENRFFSSGYKLILGLAGVLAMFLLAGSLVFSNLREAVKDSQKEKIAAIGILKANQIGEWLDDRHSDINTLAIDSYFAGEVKQWLSDGMKDDIQRLRIENRLRAFIDAHHYHAIALYDASGRFVLHVGRSIEHEEDMTEAALDAMRSGRIRLIDLHRHNDARLPVGLGFFSPLSVAGKPAGAIYFSEDPSRYLFPLIETWPVKSESAETQLVRIEGDRVLFLSRLRHRGTSPMEFSLPLNTPDLAAAQALKGKSGLLEHAHDYQGVPVLSFATPIAETPWVLISKMSEKEAYALVDQVELLASALALFVLTISVAWVWQRRQREQAAQLAILLEHKMQADAALLKSEQQYHNLFDSAAVPILEEDFSQVKAYFEQLSASGVGDFRGYFKTHPEEVRRCGASVQILAVNQQGLDFFGVKSKEELKQHMPRYFLEDSWACFAEELAALAEGESRFAYEVPVRDGNGERKELLLNLSVAEGSRDTFDHVLISFIDITARKQAESRINFLAYHDRLTGLPNRALFFDRLSQAMSQARRNKKHVALLFLDLDGFKPINDIHGHEAGDAVLKMVAQRLLACVRAVDSVARLGGDEFAIVAGEIDHPAEIEKVAEKILQAFVQTMVLPEGQECSVGTSIGISIFPDNGNEMDSLLAAADAAMYDSKRSGKNTYTYFGGKPFAVNDPEAWIVFDREHHVGVTEIDEQHRELVRLVNRLNGAIKNREGDDVLHKLFEDLLSFTAFHFATEHRLMEQYGYGEIARHDAEHIQLVNEAEHLKTGLSQGRELLALQSIKDWLLNHIQYADKPLGKFLVGKGVH
ncbi:MAG: bacteriohemerythrin [Gallionella sp.]|jgi:diguanylate cyclase (GGDEF)-like protein/hemerythrin-like metal-binding protein/PAS domain S-box-containing protein|nr:bacteriohemerythrin [Gallionella sp.]MCK9354366.1 bacteriohemerythrin [Gallionella sp.]